MVADLAQLKSPSSLCLWQDEHSLRASDYFSGHIDLERIPRLYAKQAATVRKLNGASIDVDLSSILRGPDLNVPTAVSPSSRFKPGSAPLQIITSTGSPNGHHSQPQVSSHGSRQIAPASGQSARRRMPPPGLDQPAKKQSKWSPEEDALIIELRGSGMKWEDISKQLPGRSAISCRLHYQNYLERRSEWSEERKDKLAQLYERYTSSLSVLCATTPPSHPLPSPSPAFPFAFACAKF